MAKGMIKKEAITHVEMIFYVCQNRHSFTGKCATFLHSKGKCETYSHHD